MVYKLPHQPPVNSRLNTELTISLLYHDIFDFPLKKQELARWICGPALKLKKPRPKISLIGDYYVLTGREGTVAQRLKKEQVSRRKMQTLSKIRPIFESEKNVLMVGLTGSLAMNSATEASDIDLMVIVKKGRLWATRLKVLLLLIKHKIPTRRARESVEQDKLCLNIWMDETDLMIKDHNAYTAHELAQVVPLINKNHLYEKLIETNKWILNYWPNCLEVKSLAPQDSGYRLDFLRLILEKLAYWFQLAYMYPKRTREIISPTRAFFHPMDWSKKLLGDLENRGVVHVEATS